MSRTPAALLILLVVAGCGSVWAQGGDDALTVAASRIRDALADAADAERGEVVAVDGDTLYVELGSDDGVVKGQLLDLRAKGDLIDPERPEFGTWQTTVGLGEVHFVQNEHVSEAKVIRMEPGATVEKGMVAYVRSVPSRLAVASFEQTGGSVSQMGQEFADALGTVLQSAGKFRMLERSRLEAILAEQKLNLDDLFDPAKAAQLGNLVTAEAVVMGTITQQDAGYTLNARVVDIETGVQVATAEATCPRGDKLDAKFSNKVATTGGGGGQTGGGGGGGGNPLDEEPIFAKGVKWIRNTGAMTVMSDVTIGGIYWSKAMGVEGSFTVVLDRQWETVTMDWGLNDAETSTRLVKVVFATDGEAIKDITLRPGTPPERVTIDVSGANALSIITENESGGVFGGNVARRVLCRQGIRIEPVYDGPGR